MGRQIRFFMVQQDERRFLDFIVARHDKILLPKFGKVPIDVHAFSANDAYQFFITTTQGKLVERGGFIDELTSDVIEFDRCKIKNGREMDYGRLWVETKFWDEQGQLVTKEKWVNDFYESYRKWIRKEYRLSKDKGFYIAEEAYRLYRAGKLKMMATPKLAVEFD